MTEPTDAELDELRQANSGRLNFVTLREFRTIARAVLAKWGTPAPVGMEPYGYVFTAQVATGMGDTRMTPQTFFTHTKPPCKALPLYTTPQPTQTQAGAVPLTDEQIEDLLICGNPTDEEKRLIRMGWDAAHGIKGGQHGTAGRNEHGDPA